MRTCLAILIACISSAIFADGALLYFEPNTQIKITNSPHETAFFENRSELHVTGTYSRADEFGIDGIAIMDGILKSKVDQSWGGVLLVQDAKAEIFPISSVRLNGESYDLKSTNRLYSFIEEAKLAKISLIQSHLLIKDGALDLGEINNPPKFIRRILFTDLNGEIGIWQSSKPLSLFEATRELQAVHAPQMAINLDMGDHDYCRRFDDGQITNCGDPIAGVEALSNVIMLTQAKSAK